MTRLGDVRAFHDATVELGAPADHHLHRSDFVHLDLNADSSDPAGLDAQ